MIHCIGDSHVSFFGGKDEVAPSWTEFGAETWGINPMFRPYRIGPYLAYSVGTQGHEGYRSLLVVLGKIPRGADVMLVFGEIDCRAHLLRQRDRQARPLEDVAADCVARYFRTVDEVQSMGYRVIVFGGIPTGCEAAVRNDDGPWAYHGSARERNQTARLFDQNVVARCSAKGIRSLSIFDELVDEEGDTKREYFMDAIHLSQAAMPLVMARLKEAKE